MSGTVAAVPDTAKTPTGSAGLHLSVATNLITRDVRLSPTHFANYRDQSGFSLFACVSKLFLSSLWKLALTLLPWLLSELGKGERGASVSKLL